RVSFGLTFIEEKAPHEFEGRFHRLGARVAEKNAVHPTLPTELTRELNIRLCIVVVRQMHQLPCLPTDGTNERWMIVSERVDSDAGEKIDVAFARLIPELRSLTPI